MLNKTVINAVILIKELKVTPGMKLKDFCAKKKLSLHFMEQIGRKLSRAKIIDSKRGPGGGYSVSREKVSLAELIPLFKIVKSKDAITTKALKALEAINVLD